MSAKVSFLSQEVTPEQQKPLLAVQPDALVAARRAARVVFVVRDGKARAVPVTPAQKIGDLTAIAGDGQARARRPCCKPAAIARRRRAGEGRREVARRGALARR